MDQPSYRRPDKVLVYLYRRSAPSATAPSATAASAIAASAVAEAAVAEAAVIAEASPAPKLPAFYLLLLRHPERTLAGAIWQTVVGSVRWTEERIQAARREVYEETGLTMLRGITAIGYAFSFPIRLPKNQESWYAPDQTTIDNTVFAAEVIGRRPILLSPEHQAYGWFSFEDALEKLHWPEEKEALSRLHPMIAAQL
jgi:dATP pyrophosphohydrolase